MTNIWYLQINRICNHDCIYCSNPSFGKMMDLQEVKDWLASLKASWYDSIILTGGEPTIHPHIFEIIRLVNENWLKTRIITNWTGFANEEFTAKIKEIWVELVHISFYTYDGKLTDYIRRFDWAFKNIVKAFLNLRKYGIETQTTTAISKLNQDHLLKNVIFTKKVYPEIKHFVWNVLDPKVMKKTQEAIDSLPDLNNITDELVKTFSYLESIWNTFRIEKIPLCKIPWFERANTECRKLIKNQSRKVIFLDERQTVEQQPEGFRYDYLPECKDCALYDVCGWVFVKDEFYPDVTVEPLKDKKYLKKLQDIVLRDK